MHVEASWGPQNSKFSHFCNPYGVICTFSRAQHGGEPPIGIHCGSLFSEIRERWGALRIVNNGPEWSFLDNWGLLERLGGSLEVLREGLWRSSEGAWGLLGRS